VSLWSLLLRVVLVRGRAVHVVVVLHVVLVRGRAVHVVPASEGGTEWREQPASGEAAAAEAGEPHGHGGFKLSGFGTKSERARL
jgi:hypothetical protein